MRYFFTFLLLSCSTLISAQDTQTEKLMAQIGYQKVDMEALNKKQLTEKPCATCPMKSTNKNNQNRPINSAHEIIKLQNQIPELEQRIKTLNKDKNSDPAVLQKYQRALLNNLEQIKYLENQSVQKKLK
jgi:hypothetical protein